MAVPTADTYSGTPGQPIYGGRVAPPPVGVPNTLALSLPSGSATGYPLQFGRAFAQGEITGQIQVSLDGTPLAEQQSDVKTRYADNSVKFAIISVIVPSLGATEKQLTITSGATAHGNTSVTRASMLADFDFDATIRISKSGTPLLGSPVSARAMLTALSDAALASETAAFGVNSRYWTQGPVCTTVLLRNHTTKTYDMGSTADKVLRPQFAVEFWPTIGRYRVRFIVEASDVVKYGGETGLTIEFETGNISKTVHLNETKTTGIYSGTKDSRRFWNGATQIARCNLDHNDVYLSSTKAITNFNPARTVTAAAIAGFASDWAAQAKTLGSTGYWKKDMAGTGGNLQISLMPKWEVMSLRNGSATMAEILERNSEFFTNFEFFQREGDAARTFLGVVPALGRVMSKQARPTLFKNDRIGGTDGYIVPGIGRGDNNLWVGEDAHTPGAFFASYLTTGEHYWLESLQQLAAWTFALPVPSATYSHYTNGNSLTDLVATGSQTRSSAWAHRNRGRAWWASEDGSPESDIFLKSLDDTCAMRFGLFDLPYMLDSPIRQGWYTNAGLYYYHHPASGRPNPLYYWTYNWDEYNPVANITGGGPVYPMWQEGYLCLAFIEAADLGHAYSLPIAKAMTKKIIDFALSPQPAHIADYNHPYCKNDGSWWLSVSEVLDAWQDEGTSGSGGMTPNPAAGFVDEGTLNTPAAKVEVTGAVHTAVVAMAAGQGHTNAAEAWAVLKPWADATPRFNEDPRYDCVPRVI